MKSKSSEERLREVIRSVMPKAAVPSMIPVLTERLVQAIHSHVLAIAADDAIEENPYFVEVDNNGCPGCWHGRSWVVVDPDGSNTGTSYGSEEDAGDLAQDLNRAFNRGRNNSNLVVREVGE